jgi:2-isopropylmalate synthase
VTERDLDAIVTDLATRHPETYALVHVQVSCGTGSIPTATVRLRRTEDDVLLTESAQGTGPVDAVCKAVNKMVGDVGVLTEFAVDAVTEGINAVGAVTIHVDGHVGYGVDTDIIVAAARAYVAALNKRCSYLSGRDRCLRTDPAVR